MPDLLGAHMSIAGGLYRALERGHEAGCSVVQIFLKNQLQWTAKPYTREEIRQFAATWKATGIRTVFAHSSYLINLAAPPLAEWTRAVSAFHDELERAEALALPFVIIHPGSHKGQGLEAGIRRIVGALDEVTSRTRGYRVRVLLENRARRSGGALKSWPRSSEARGHQSASASASTPAISSPPATTCEPALATRA
jgi:deoxyribonuclease IV